MSTEKKFATQLQTAADILDRLAQILAAANTENGGMFPLHLANELMECGKELEGITLGELHNVAMAARERADAQARRMRELCTGY